MIITKSQPMYMPLVRLCAIKERELPYGREAIDLPSKVVEWSRQLLMYADKEYLLVIPVDTMMKPVGIEIVSVGSISAAYVEPREVFKHAITCNARGIVVVHNHPSGNTTPSEADKNITKRLKTAGDILGIKLFDHIIIGDGDEYTSLAEDRGEL